MKREWDYVRDMKNINTKGNLQSTLKSSGQKGRKWLEKGTKESMYLKRKGVIEHQILLWGYK